MLPDYRVRQRDLLLEITRALTQELDLDKLLKTILRQSAEILAGQAGLILLHDEVGGWKISASHGISPALVKYLDPLLAEVPDHEDPARFELPEINRILQAVARQASLGLLTGVGLPMIVRNQVIGVIFIFRNYPSRFSSNDQVLLQSFADQAAVAVQNATLYTQVNAEKERLNALLDSVADGFLIMTPDNTVTRCNPAFTRISNLPRDQVQGKTHGELIRFSVVEHGETLEKAEAGGWPLNPKATLYVEGDLIRNDESTLPVGITYAPLYNQENKLINIIASLRDITHFRQAEDLQSTFVSVISHELKTPVALIKGYVGTLRREDAVWEREIVEDSLAVIEEEADRLAELIDNLLDASRLEAGVLAINATDLSLPALASRVIDRFMTQTQNHQFCIDFPEDFPVILADEDRLSQVFYNMISNAIKYSPTGGEICITGEVRKDIVIVCVKDQGQGIATSDIPHIFDRFYRAENAKRKTKGAGLGLYLTRAIIEAHHGSIWIVPNPDEGACICFSLPRQQESRNSYK